MILSGEAVARGVKVTLEIDSMIKYPEIGHWTQDTQKANSKKREENGPRTCEWREN